MNITKKTEGSITLFFIIGLAVILLIALGLLFWRNVTVQPNANSVPGGGVLDAPQKSEIKNNDTEIVSSSKTGTITGNVVYPIEFLSNADRNKGKIFPDDLKICALVSSTEKEVACETGFSSTKDTYSITVPEELYGGYLIRATTGDKTAYYDRYVQDDSSPIDPCAASTSLPIVVSVGADQTITGVHAADFWVGHLGC